MPAPIRIVDRLGSSLSSLDHAASLREELLAAKTSLRNAVELDFSGVRRMSYPFALELFGRLTTQLGYRAFRRRVRITHMSPSNRIVLAVALEGIRRSIRNDLGT